MNMFSLEGKIALVTGASYGIGFAIAEGLAQAGATIVFNDINQELVNKGLAAYEEKGIKAHGYVCDVTDEPAVQNLIDHLAEIFCTHLAHGDALDDTGVIDQNINNADFLLNGSYQCIDSSLIGHIADIAVSLYALFGITGQTLVHQLLIDVIEADGGAGFSIGAGNGKANAVGCAGDQGNLALKRKIGVSRHMYFLP